MAKVRPARGELKTWLEAGEGRSQGMLGKAVGVSQQTISAFLGGRSPTEGLAQLIEEATGIAWRGWFTPAELRERKQERERRLAKARALRTAVLRVHA